MYSKNLTWYPDGPLAAVATPLPVKRGEIVSAQVWNGSRCQITRYTTQYRKCETRILNLWYRKISMKKLQVLRFLDESENNDSAQLYTDSNTPSWMLDWPDNVKMAVNVNIRCFGSWKKDYQWIFTMTNYRRTITCFLNVSSLFMGSLYLFQLKYIIHRLQIFGLPNKRPAFIIVHKEKHYIITNVWTTQKTHVPYRHWRSKA